MKTSINVQALKTRREFLKATGLVTVSLTTTALPLRAAPDPTASVSGSPGQPRSCIPGTNFERWKHLQVGELATRSQPSIPAEQAERHTIYSLALMAIALYYWNGNKYGLGLEYPLNERIPS
jgi:hypothetical protein